MKSVLLFVIVSLLYRGNDAAPNLLKEPFLALQGEPLEIADKPPSSANGDSPAKEPRKSCPSGWQEFQGSCYFIQTNQVSGVTFASAQAKCESIYAGSSLVALETTEETNFIKKYLQDQYTVIRQHTSNGWMTSGHKKNGEWTWNTTGAAIETSTFHWGPGQPDNQDCLSFWPAYQFDMADVSCNSYSRQFVCEI